MFSKFPSNARRVLSQCNTRLRLLYLLNIIHSNRGEHEWTEPSYKQVGKYPLNTILGKTFRDHITVKANNVLEAGGRVV